MLVTALRSSDGAILDADDRLADVADDREQLTACVLRTSFFCFLQTNLFVFFCFFQRTSTKSHFFVCFVFFFALEEDDDAVFGPVGAKGPASRGDGTSASSGDSASPSPDFLLRHLHHQQQQQQVITPLITPPHGGRDPKFGNTYSTPRFYSHKRFCLVPARYPTDYPPRGS